MNKDRRNFLSSVAAATICAPVISAPKLVGAGTRPDALHEGREAWLLAIQHHQHSLDHAVDFWARPWCDIPYTRYLPREIARAALWYEKLDGLVPNDCLNRLDADFKFHCRNSETPRKVAVYVGGLEGLSSPLQSLIGSDGTNPAERTAFVSLDSIGPVLKEPGWADVLPALKSCYAHTIGHFHLEQRGLRQWRRFLNAHFHSEKKGGYFQEFFTEAAVQCDAVVVTSPALIESDLNCCPRASTEELVGELMRQFGYALLTAAVRNRIVDIDKNQGTYSPRLFALTSLTLKTTDDYYLHFSHMINRQADLIRGSFGDPISGEPLLLIATAAEAPYSDIVDEIRQTAGCILLHHDDASPRDRKARL